jgi:hypothetical protein
MWGFLADAVSRFVPEQLIAASGLKSHARAPHLIKSETLASVTALDRSSSNRIPQLRKLTQHIEAD